MLSIFLCSCLFSVCFSCKT